MFDPFGDGGWEPEPWPEREMFGSWDVPDEPDGVVAIPAGNDALIHEAQLSPLGLETLPLLVNTPFEALSDEGRSLALRRMTEFSAYVEALKTELTAVIAGPRRATLRERLDDFASHEIGVATKCSVYAADARIALARDLADRLAATGEAMRRGEISYQQAAALSDATCRLDVAVARRIESKLLRFSHRQDLRLFRAALRGWMAKLDPDFAAKAKEARKECEVSHTAFDDGTGQIYIRGPLEITTAFHMALTAYAAKTKASLGGTVDQRKVAAVRGLAEISLGAPDTPRHHGQLQPSTSSSTSQRSSGCATTRRRFPALDLSPRMRPGGCSPTAHRCVGWSSIR